MKQLKRILIFELNWLGDILFSFPFLRAVREAFPEAHIACAVVPRYAELVADNPWVDEIYRLSDDNGLLSVPEKMMFILKIRKRKYDACFLLKPSRIKTFMAALAGIPERVGFGGKGAPLTRKVKVPAGRTHQADQLLVLAEDMGAVRPDGSYEYFISEENDRDVEHLLNESGGLRRRVVAINPGGNWPAKRWPTKRFVSLAKRMLERFDDIEIAVTGAEKDIACAGEIAAETGSGRCYVLAGKTGLNVLAALFKKCALVISADSGPLHLASAAGAATIGLYGPTSPDVTGPRGKGKNIVISRNVGCRVPCYMVAECAKENECMTAITVDEVFAAAEKVLAGRGL